MKNKKETSYMGNVGITIKIDDVPELKDELIAVFKSKKNISRYGLLKEGSYEQRPQVAKAIALGLKLRTM